MTSVSFLIEVFRVSIIIEGSVLSLKSKLIYKGCSSMFEVYVTDNLFNNSGYSVEKD